MEYALYLLTGAIFKVYDDITDAKEDISSYQLELLKVILTTLTTISFIKSASLNFFFCIISLICLYIGQTDTDFWKAWAIVPFIIILFHVPHFMSLSIIDLSIHIMSALFFMFIIVVEHKLIPEDMSLRKYYSRIGLFLLELSGAYISNIYGYSYLVPLCLFYSGYFGANLLYHFPAFLALLQNTDKTETKTPTKE